MSLDKDLPVKFAFGNSGWVTEAASQFGTLDRAFVMSVIENPQNTKKFLEYQKHCDEERFELDRQQHSEQIFRLNEIEYQIQDLAAVSRQGFTDVVSVVDHLERTIGMHLSDIKATLGQMDDKLAAIFHVTAFRRHAESQELIFQGLAALKTNHLDDAEDILREAVKLEKTNCQARLNYAELFIQKGDLESATEQLKKAVDYADYAKDAESKIQANENLARAFYVARDFCSAQKTMKTALDTRKEAARDTASSHYLYAKYCYLAGDSKTALEEIQEAIKRDAAFYKTVWSDSDFDGMRNFINGALESLARNTFEESCAKIEVEKDRFLRLSERIQQEYAAQLENLANAIGNWLKKAEAQLKKKTYSNSLAAREIADLAEIHICELETMLVLLPQYDEARKVEERLSKEMAKTTSSPNIRTGDVVIIIVCILLGLGLAAAIGHYWITYITRPFRLSVALSENYLVSLFKLLVLPLIALGMACLTIFIGSVAFTKAAKSAKEEKYEAETKIGKEKRENELKILSLQKKIQVTREKFDSASRAIEQIIDKRDSILAITSVSH
jgi:tetratricopeptide (TPR) repeat protein